MAVNNARVRPLHEHSERIPMRIALLMDPRPLSQVLLSPHFSLTFHCSKSGRLIQAITPAEMHFLISDCPQCCVGVMVGQVDPSPVAS
jgi:hypothetical protein